ncbi:hypothetical protein U1Q18_020821, partial [Sarracenia purpurea var. burkii]
MIEARIQTKKSKLEGSSKLESRRKNRRRIFDRRPFTDDRVTIALVRFLLLQIRDDSVFDEP